MLGAARGDVAFGVIVEVGFRHLSEAPPLRVEEADDELDLLRFGGDGTLRPWLGEVLDVPAVGDQTIEAMTIGEGGLDGVMREVVRREDEAERAALPLPGRGAVAPGARERRTAVGVAFEAN